MKKLRLKSWVKKALIITISYMVIVGVVIAYQNRIEKINNGSFVLISDSEMDR